MKRWFYTGRHHAHTAKRDAAGQLVTVAMLTARIRREEREAELGSVSLVIEPDTRAFADGLRRELLGLFANAEQFAPEQLGAMSV